MAVFEVILNDKISDLKDLLEADPKCANSVGWHGLTPLHHAALKGNQELADLLLQYGANVNQPNAYGETPLHLACQAASLRFVHKFLEIGAELRAEDSAGRTCIHHAAKSGSILKLHYLTACGLSLKKRDNRGQTALHAAAEHGQLETCEYLLRHKRFASDVRDSTNATPLHLAAKYAHCEIAWALESQSTLSMINEPDVAGKTPVDYASEGNSPRHFWLKRHLNYWQASRCPRSRPPNPWMPWFLLLLSPSFGIFLIVLSISHLSTLLATLVTLGIIVFFNVWSFSRHRLQHISAIPNPALAGYFFGLIIQSLLCHFLYIIPQLWPELFWTPLAVILLIATFVTLKNLFSDPGVVTSNRISETGETMTILDVAKGVISECNFCTVCEGSLAVTIILIDGSEKPNRQLGCELQILHVIENCIKTIVMPEFTKHCRLCEVCLLSLDHHCLFLLSCVARNNHRAFVFFMIEVMLANLLFVRAAVSYFNLKIFLGEASSFSEAMGHDVYLSVLFVINSLGFFYVFFLTWFQFKVITDGGTTYYSSNGRNLHRTWKDIWQFQGIPCSQRMKIFLQFLLGEYSFYKSMKKKQAQRLV